jgi:hypothetical protein
MPQASQKDALGAVNFPQRGQVASINAFLDTMTGQKKSGLS